VILVENDFHSNVSFGLMAKAYHALVGTFVCITRWNSQPVVEWSTSKNSLAVV